MKWTPGQIPMCKNLRFSLWFLYDSRISWKPTKLIISTLTCSWGLMVMCLLQNYIVSFYIIGAWRKTNIPQRKILFNVQFFVFTLTLIFYTRDALIQYLQRSICIRLIWPEVKTVCSWKLNLKLTVTIGNAYTKKLKIKF